MSELPGGWVEVALGEIAETRLGKMLSAKARVGPSPRPYLRNKNVQWGRFDLEDVWSMDFSDEEFARFEVVPGDLLVCEGGEVGRAAIWRGALSTVGYQKALHRVRPAGGIVPEYLLYLFMRLAQTNGFEPFVTGSTIKHLPQEDLRELPVPLPPLNEQRRIVAAIEEQFSRLDAADESLGKAELRLKAFRIAAYRATVDGDWRVEQLSRVADVRLGRQRSPKNHAGENMRPYLRAANVTWAGLDLSDVKQMQFSPAEVDVYRLEPGDVLVAEASGSASEVGKTAIWRGDIENCCFQNTVLRVRARGPAPDFVRVVLQHAAVTGAFGRASAGVGIHHLGAARLSAWPVPVPPLEEQRGIVAEIEQRVSQIDAMRAAIEAAQRRSAALRRSILERAFRGELVPQDPSDEPASVLLERIAAERATAETANGGRPRRRATMQRS